MRRLSTLLAATLCALAPAGALAQSSQGAIAESLFREGQELMKAGKIAKACEKLAASYQLDPALGTLLNLAVCHEKEGKTASAWTELSDVVSKAERAGQKERAAYAQGRATALEPKLLRVTLSVTQPSLSQEVRLDGNALPAAAWDTAIPLDPGDHRVEATAPGKKQWEQSFHIGADTPQQTLVVPVLQDGLPATTAAILVPPPAPLPAAAQRSAPEEPPASFASMPQSGVKQSTRSPRRTLGLALDGAGAALIAGGGVCGVLALGKHSDAKSATTEKELSDARSAGKTRALVADILYGAGAVALGVGLYFTFSGAPSSAPATVTAAPVPGGGAVLVAGGF